MNIAEALLGITKYREKIYKENLWEAPVDLSDVMTKLAVYKSFLADYIAPAHKKATDKQTKAFLDGRKLGLSVSESEIQARANATDERQDYENLLNVYRATSDLISVIQTRLRVIGQEERNEQ